MFLHINDVGQRLAQSVGVSIRRGKELCWNGEVHETDPLFNIGTFAFDAADRMTSSTEVKWTP